MVSVIIAKSRVHAMLAFSSLREIVTFVTIIELSIVKFTHPGNRISAIETLDSTCFIFIRVSPRNWTIPVKIRLYRITFLVLFNLESLVSTVSRVGKTFADNRVAYPIYELFVFSISNFGFIHPETINRHSTRVGFESPCAVSFLRAYLH